MWITKEISMFAGMASKEVPGSADHGLLPMVLWSHSVCIIFFGRSE
jgi:hypothetical protein